MTGRSKSPEFEALKRQFDDDPSLENYLQIRRTFPRDVFDPPLMPAGLGLLITLRGDLDEFDINLSVLASALEGDQQALDLTCLDLAEAFSKQRRQKESGSTSVIRRKKAIPTSLLDVLLFELLKAVRTQGMHLPATLLLLIGERLRLRNSSAYKRDASAMNRSTALQIWIDLEDEGENPSFHKVASRMGVAHTTVSRWFFENPGEPSFERQIESLRRARRARKAR